MSKEHTHDHTINVSEIFHSLQGEGSTMGKPSVFLRLKSCNLLCGGMGTQKDKKLHDGAEWRCDTIETWMEGAEWETLNLATHLYEEYAGKFLAGSQLVITGGEPLLQQDQFRRLSRELVRLIKNNIRVEVETNGTILPTVDVQMTVDQFNVSPKLSNSGMPKKRRIKPPALGYFSRTEKSIFKFVVTKEEDINEIIDDYIEPFDILNEKIYLMPGCSTQKEFAETAPMVAEICDKYGFHFSSRLQINLWNKTTGV